MIQPTTKPLLALAAVVGEPSDLTSSNGRAPAVDPERALAALRIGIGALWAANLIFILLPANQFFPTFAATAAGYGGSTLGGPGFATFVATYPMLFAGLIAVVTAYLAVAFLLGVTVRAACLVGAGFALALLLTQWGSTFVIPGGTDVGPQPLYLVIYAALLAGDPGRHWSVLSLGSGRSAPHRASAAAFSAPHGRP